MSLSIYNGTPLISSNQVSVLDLYTGTGSQTTFTVVNKPITDLGYTIQAGNVQYYAFNGGFTINTGANTFTLSSAPGLGTQIVAPGQIQAVVAAFDQPQVLGVTNPETGIIPLWIGDTVTINNFKYYQLPGYPGIQLSVANLISGAVPQTSWISFASADASGNAMTFGATGAPLYLPPLDAFTTLSSSLTPGATALFVGAASGGGTQFWPGQYIRINIGNGTQEVCHISNINYGAGIIYLDSGGVTYSHSPGKTIYACAWKFFLSCTIPTNANNNTAVNAYSIGLARLNAIRARP